MASSARIDQATCRAKTLAGKLVEQGQDAKTRSVFGLIFHKVPAPHLPRLNGTQPLTLLRTHPALPSLPWSDLEPSDSPQPLPSLRINP